MQKLYKKYKYEISTNKLFLPSVEKTAIRLKRPLISNESSVKNDAVVGSVGDSEERSREDEGVDTYDSIICFISAGFKRYKHRIRKL